MAREAARKTTCLNNQGQLGKAVLNFATTKDKFPASFSVQPGTNIPPNNPAISVGWVPPMLPYIEQNPLYQMYQKPPDPSGVNPTLSQYVGLGNTLQLDVLICPSRSPTNSPPRAATS